MHICNDGQASVENWRRGTYDGQTFVGRDSAALDKGRVSKTGRLENWPRLDLHVWNMVAEMLKDMGYGRK